MKLVNPTVKYKSSYLNLIKSAKANGDINEMGNAYRENETFNEMIKRLKDRRNGHNLAPCDVPSSMKWIIENNEVVGTIDLRHMLNQSYFERLGHIAYYIHPSKRNKGYATKALSKAIKWYRKKPINNILITCYSDNEASKKVILHNGGILEKSIKDNHSNKIINRYLIKISDNNNYVYHGSVKRGLRQIKRNKSTHGKFWVYATLSKAISTIFISKKGSDLYYYLSGDGTENNPVILVERKENMFKDIFNVSGSLYTLSGKNFISGKTGWSAEVVSESDEDVIHEEHIDNVFKKLKELNDEGELKLYLYPNRPPFLPKDNSDLIHKAIRWKNRGINIDQFFKLYPELKKQFLSMIKENEK